jgi:hypothetical protein
MGELVLKAKKGREKNSKKFQKTRTQSPRLRVK